MQILGIIFIVWGVITLDIYRIAVGALVFIISYGWSYYKHTKRRKNLLNSDRLFPLYYNFNEYLEKHQKSISVFTNKEKLACVFVVTGAMYSLVKQRIISKEEFSDLFFAVFDDKQHIVGLTEKDIEFLKLVVVQPEKLGGNIRELIVEGEKLIADNAVLHPINAATYELIMQVTAEDSFPSNVSDLKGLLGI